MSRRSIAAATLARSGGAAPPASPTTMAAERTTDYERWLAEQTERWDPVMAWLGIVFALLALFQLAGPGLSEGWETAFDVAVWAIWAIFVLDFVARLIAAPSAGTFLRRHWLAALMLLVPTLRILRFGALLRIGRALPAARVVSTSYRATGIARSLLRSRTSYLAAVVAVVILATAQLGWLLEREHSTFASFGDALIWAATAVIALQGDPVPVSLAGRLVMLGAFAVGLVVVATLAGTVGAYLLEQHDERRSRQDP